MTTADKPCGNIQVFNTPEQIRLVQLLSARGAIRLEQRGLRHSRLGKNGVKRLWVKHFHLPPRTSFDELLDRFDLEINKLKEQLNVNPNV
jgi:hypothetical protein